LDRLFATACGNNSESGNVLYIEVFVDILQLHYAIIVKGIKGITFKELFFCKICLPSFSMHGIWLYCCYRELLQSFRDSIILRSTIQLDNYLSLFFSYLFFFILSCFIPLPDHSIKSPVSDPITVCFFFLLFGTLASEVEKCVC